jgi:tetratricopeptide (TPR) repeat protein
LLFEAGNEVSKEKEKPLIRNHVIPALCCCIHARNLCPLLPEPQRFLADFADKLERADPRSAYLERATLLLPRDPALWYLCGEEVLDEHPDQTWKYWRRSLELSDFYLSIILPRSAARLTPGAICAEVLPPNPKLLLTVAAQFYAEPSPERQVFLDRALDLAQIQSGPVRTEDFHVKALILRALGRSEEALAAYQSALAQEPHQVEWRLEFAQLLYQQKRLRESRRELLSVLAQKPDQADARELLTALERQIAESM